MDIYIKKVENGYLVISTKQNIAMIGHEQTNTYIAKDASEVVSRLNELLAPSPTEPPRSLHN